MFIKDFKKAEIDLKILQREWRAAKIEWQRCVGLWEKTSGQKLNLKEIPKSEKEWPCELVLLALGFTGPEKSLPEQFGVNLNEKNNIFSNNNYQTNKSNIFVAGDCRRGQSLIVWAISEGREAAYHIDTFLMGKSNLSQKSISGDLIDM